METIVELPDGTEIEFPEGMDDLAIRQELAKLYPEVAGQLPSQQLMMPAPSGAGMDTGAGGLNLFEDKLVGGRTAKPLMSQEVTPGVEIAQTPTMGQRVAEAGERPEEQALQQYLEAPIVDLPSEFYAAGAKAMVKALPGGLAVPPQITEGVAAASEEMTEGMSSRAGLATLPYMALGGAEAKAIQGAGIVGRTIAAGFGAQGVEGMIQSVPEFVEAVRQGNIKEAARTAAHTAMGAAMALGGAAAVIPPNAKGTPPPSGIVGKVLHPIQTLRSLGLDDTALQAQINEPPGIRRALEIGEHDRALDVIEQAAIDTLRIKDRATVPITPEDAQILPAATAEAFRTATAPESVTWTQAPDRGERRAQIKAQRPVVPETGPELERNVTVLEEIRRAGARTKDEIRKLFPHLTREQAKVLRDQAWPELAEAERNRNAPKERIVQADLPAELKGTAQSGVPAEAGRSDLIQPAAPKPETPVSRQGTREQLMREGLTEQQAADMLTGKLSVSDAVDSILSEFVEQMSESPRSQMGSHEDAIRQAREQANQRLTDILAGRDPNTGKSAAPEKPGKVAPPTKAEAPAAPAQPGAAQWFNKPLDFWRKYRLPVNVPKMPADVRAALVKFTKIEDTPKAIAEYLSQKIAELEAKPTAPAVDPQAVGAPARPVSEWLREALKEREKQGWNPQWPFVPADLLNKSFRDAILADPTLPIEEKRRIMKFAPAEAAEEMRAFEAKVEKPKAPEKKPALTPDEEAELRKDLAEDLGEDMVDTQKPPAEAPPTEPAGEWDRVKNLTRGRVEELHRAGEISHETFYRYAKEWNKTGRMGTPMPEGPSAPKPGAPAEEGAAADIAAAKKTVAEYEADPNRLKEDKDLLARAFGEPSELTDAERDRIQAYHAYRKAQRRAAGKPDLDVKDLWKEGTEDLLSEAEMDSADTSGTQERRGFKTREEAYQWMARQRELAEARGESLSLDLRQDQEYTVGKKGSKPLDSYHVVAWYTSNVERFHEIKRVRKEEAHKKWQEKEKQRELEGISKTPTAQLKEQKDTLIRLTKEAEQRGKEPKPSWKTTIEYIESELQKRKDNRRQIERPTGPQTDPSVASDVLLHYNNEILRLQKQLAVEQKKLDKNVAKMGSMVPPPIVAEVTRKISDRMAKIQDQIDALEAKLRKLDPTRPAPTEDVPDTSPPKREPTPKDTVDRFLQEQEQRRKETEDLVARNMAKVPDDATAIRLEDKDGKYALVTPDPAQPGKWRLTWFTKEGEPWGHGVLDSRNDAIQSGLGIYGKSYGPPHLGRGYEVVEAKAGKPAEAPAEAPAQPGDQTPAGPEWDFVRKLRQRHSVWSQKAVEIKAKLDQTIDKAWKVKDEKGSSHPDVKDLVAEEKRLRKHLQRLGHGISRLEGQIGLERMRAEAAQRKGKPVEQKPPQITNKVLKAQKENLLSQLDDAIKEAPEDGKEQITISVPGDGEFTVTNTKAALKSFRTLAEKQFPAAVVKADEPGLPSGKAKNIPKAVDPDPKDLGKIAGPFVSGDETRAVITSSYADGTQIVATDGRQLIRIVTDKAPGKPDKPVRLTEKGEPTQSEGNFPDFRIVRSANPELVYGGMKTDELWKIARQAQVFRKTFGDLKSEPGLQIQIHPDRTIGARMEIEGNVFEYNYRPDGLNLGHYNADYLLNAADAARRLGNETVDVYFHGTEGTAPLGFVGKNHESIVMGLRVGEGDIHAAPSKFTSVAGRKVHSIPPEGLGPLRDPEMSRNRVAEPEGSTWNAILENGEIRLEKKMPKHGTQDADAWHETGKMPLADYPGNAKAQGDAIRALMGEKVIEELGKTRAAAAITKIKEAIKDLTRERERDIAEAESRTSGKGPEIEGGIAGDLLQPAEGAEPDLFQGGSKGAGALTPMPGTASAPPMLTPKSQREIITDLAKALNIPIRFGRLLIPRYGGYFLKLQDLITSKRPNDIPVATHEGGHKLDAMFNIRHDPLIAAELDRLGDPATPGSRSSWNKKKSHDYKLGEGVAEFVRYWMTDPAHAQATAPQTFKYFEQILDINKDLGDKLRMTQSDIFVWRNSHPQARLRSRISIGTNPNGSPYTLSQLARDLVDDLHIARLAFDDAERVLGRPLSPSENGYMLARLLRGSYGMASTFIQKGVVDFKTKEVQMGTGLEEIWKPITSRAMEFRDYMVARQAAEMHRQGKATGLLKDEIDATLNRYKGDVEFETAFAKTRQWLDSLLQYTVDAGLITPQSAAAMRTMYQDYVPLHRVFELGAGEAPGGEGGSGAGRGLNAGKPGSLQHRSGSIRDIVDPMETIVRNAYVMITAAEKAYINRAVAGLWNKPQMGRWVEKVAYPMEKVTVELEKIRRQLENAGADLSNVSPDLLLEFFQFANRAPWGENIVRLVNNGKAEYYRLNKDLYNTFHALDLEDSGKFWDALAAHAQILRSGVVLAPDFAINNVTRDSFAAAVLSKYGTFPFQAAIKGFAAMLRNPKLVAEWAAAGGQNAIEITFFDRVKTERYLRERQLLEWTPKERALHIAGWPLRKLRELTGLFEEATRVGEYEIALNQMLKRGMPVGEARRLAAFESRDRQDFAKGGAKMKLWRRWVPFWNAALQSNAKIYERARHDPARFVAQGFAFVTIPKLLEQYVNWDDQSYWDRPQWERDHFYLIPIYKDSKGHTRFFRVPTPFLIGTLFATIPGRILQYGKQKDPKAFDDLWKEIAKESIPVPMPPSASMVLELAAGKQGYDFFRGRPIVSGTVADMPPEWRYTEQTSLTAQKTAKLLAKAGMPISPMKVDHAIARIAGGLGRYATHEGIDRVISAATGEPRTAQGKGFRSRFVTTQAGIQSQAVDDFYKNLDSVEAEAQRQKLTGKADDIRRLLPAFRQASLQMAALRKKARQTQDPDKRQEYQLQIIERARKMNERFRQFQKGK